MSPTEIPWCRELSAGRDERRDGGCSVNGVRDVIAGKQEASAVAQRLISAHRVVREELAVAIDTIVDRLDAPTDYVGARIGTPLSWALFGLALERTLNPDEMTDAAFEDLVASTVKALVRM
jgi:hypothetical protein